MYEKILVPLDGSKLAEVALPYAEELAGRLGSEIILISVLLFGNESNEDQYHHLHEFYSENMVKTTRQYARKYAETPVQKTTKVSSVILVGDPVEQIVDYAEKEDIDLIVMGTRGHTGMKRWVLGSVSDKIVSAVECPVALITTEEPAADVREEKDVLNRILVTLDGSPEGEVIIPYVKELASRLAMEVMLLQVVEQAYQYYGGAEDFSSVPVTEKEMNSIKARARRYLKNVAGLLEQRGINVKVKVLKGKSAEDIVQIAARINADVIAMSTRGRSGISRWVFGSVRDKVVKIGNVLVLLVRVPE